MASLSLQTINAQHGSSTSQRTRRAPKAPKLPPFEAHIESLARKYQEFEYDDDLDEEILAKIRKMRERGDKDRNSSQHEAETSMRMAFRLMSIHNVKLANQIENGVQTGTSLHGKSTVKITRRQGTNSGRVVRDLWVDVLAHSMGHYFNVMPVSLYDCKDRSYGKWHFCGITSNTILAAEAFKATFTHVLHWAMNRKGSKNSYYLGMSNGLLAIAQEEQRREMQQTVALEQRRSETSVAIGSTQDQVEGPETRAPPPVPSNDGHFPPIKQEGPMKDEHRTREKPKVECSGDDDTKANIKIGVDDTASTFNREQDERVQQLDDKVKLEVGYASHGLNGETNVHIKSEPSAGFNAIPSDTLGDDYSSNIDELSREQFEESLKNANKAFIDLTGLTDDEDDSVLDIDDDEDEDVPSIDGDHGPDTPPSDVEGGSNDHAASAKIGQDLHATPVAAAMNGSSSTEGTANEPGSGQTWNDSTQLVLFRKNAKKIAQEAVDSLFPDSKRGRKRKFRIVDREAYNDGKRDSKKVDVRGRKIHEKSANEA